MDRRQCYQIISSGIETFQAHHEFEAGQSDVQMPPPPPPGQSPRPNTQPGQGGQQQNAFFGRLPPLQQPGGNFQNPQPRPVAADWARAYREQQNKAAQVRSLTNAPEIVAYLRDNWSEITTRPVRYLRAQAVRNGPTAGPFSIF